MASQYIEKYYIGRCVKTGKVYAMDLEKAYTGISCFLEFTPEQTNLLNKTGKTCKIINKEIYLGSPGYLQIPCYFFKVSDFCTEGAVSNNLETAFNEFIEYIKRSESI